MTDLTTDERLSGQLLPVLADLQEGTARYRQNAVALRRHLSAYAARVQDVVEQRSSESADRLAELVEGLAAGTVRIVDESKLVFEIGAAVENALHRDPSAEGASSTRVAQLVLEELNTSGALR